VRVAFILNELGLSGGVGVVVEHARQLNRRHGIETTIVRPGARPGRTWSYAGLPEVPVLPLASARTEHFDVAVATWWETAHALFELRADRYAYFMQSLEDRFYSPDDPNRMGAAITHDLPVAVITEARWIAATLRELRPELEVRLVRNGIDKAVFAGPTAPAPATRGPLRVLIEGQAGVWFKGVPDALHAVRAMRESRHVTLVSGDARALDGGAADRIVGPVSHSDLARLYAESHVVLKLSRVEGMYGPPLEGFHMGATCVTTPVTGHEEYVEHGFNGLVVDWDDMRGTARALDLLAHDRALLHYLRTNALLTARAWPSWEQQGAVMAAALRSIRSAPPVEATGAAAALLADARAGLLVQREVEYDRRRLRYWMAPLLAVRELLDRPAARPVKRAIKAVLQLARRGLR
jgi:O-antigen biosynthesis protein